jgi:hypothetical protein
LEVFNRTGDDLLVSEHLLVGVTTEDVRSIIGAPASDPMYGAFVLPDTHRAWAERAAGVTLDPERFVYHLTGEFEARAPDPCERRRRRAWALLWRVIRKLRPR